MRRETEALRRPLAMALLCAIGMLCACSLNPGAAPPPPPLSTGALAGAQAKVFILAASASAAEAGSAAVCATSAGYCPVPTGTAAGQRCACEASDGSYVYAGRTGDVPAIPDWADPAKKPR